MTAPWYDTGPNMRANSIGGHEWPTCTCCERELQGAVRMLELDQRTQTYHDEQNVPPEKSQGWFPFGLTCAKKEIVKHRAALSKATEGK